MLRCTRVGYAKELSKGCHVVLAAADLLNDPKATWVPKDGKGLGKCSAGNGSEWHGAVSFAVGSPYSHIQYI